MATSEDATVTQQSKLKVQTLENLVISKKSQNNSFITYFKLDKN